MSAIRRFAAGMVVAAIAILATAAPASAHDELISSSPSADEKLADAPESITMKFSGQLLSLGDSTPGAIVIVIDENGHDWATGEVEVVGDTVTATLETGMPDAGYQLRWQVVSEDGHTVAGAVPFTVGDAEPMATSSAGGGSTNPVDQEVQDQSDQESEGAIRVLLIGAGGALIAVAIYALFRFVRRRPTTARAPDDTHEGAE